MEAKIKDILVIGDPHCSAKRKKSWDSATKEIFSKIQGYRFKHCIITGDLFDKTPTVEERIIFAKFINKLQNYAEHIILIKGTDSHEYTGGNYHFEDITILTNIRAYEELTVGNFIFGHYEVKGTKYINGYMSESKREVKPDFTYMLGHVHCFSDDVEFLTQCGWKNFYNLGNHKVATYNKGIIEYQKPLDYICENYSGQMISIESKNISSLITPTHRLLYAYKKNIPYRFRQAQEMIGKSISGNYPIAARTKEEGLFLSENHIRLLVWIVADGSFDKYSECRWHLKKERKIFRLENLLNNMNLKYKKYFCKDGTVKIDLKTSGIKKILGLSSNKVLPQKIRHLSYSQIRVLLKEYAETDGNYQKNSKKSIQISTAKKVEADLLQELCILSGCSCNLNIKKEKYYVLNIVLDNLSQNTNSKDSFSVQNYSGKVVCLTTKNQTLITRQKGKVLISGNSPQCSFDNVNYIGSIYKVSFSEINDQKRIAIIDKEKIQWIDIQSRPMYEIVLKGKSGKVKALGLKELQQNPDMEIDLKVKVITDSQTLGSIHRNIYKIKRKYNIEYYREEIKINEIKTDVPEDLDKEALLKKYCKERKVDYSLIEKELNQ